MIKYADPNDFEECGKFCSNPNLLSALSILADNP